MRGLLLVDIQNDYFPGGRMELRGMVEASRQAARLLHEFRARSLPIVHIQHLATRPGATFFLPGTSGSEIHASVSPSEGELVLEKHFPNAFRETGLLARLQFARAEELVICGAMSHMCIDATTRAAFDLGFRCTVAEDACATRDVQFKGETVPAAQVHAAFMAALASTYASVVTTDAYLDAK